MGATVKLGFIAILVFMVAALSGCPPTGPVVKLDYNKYDPSVSQNQVFKGKKVALLAFTNRAGETSMFYYFRPGGDLAYDTNELVESYVWYCFRNAFRKAGMQVLEDVQQKSVPDFHLTITRLDEGNFEFVVNFTKDNFSLMKKKYAVQADQVRGGADDPAALEKNAYLLINKAISAVLEDPEFQDNLQK